MEKNNKVESFSLDFIKEKIAGLLSKIKQVKKIEKLEIKGLGDKIKIDTKIKAKEGIFSVKVNIGLTLTNENNKIVARDYSVDAGVLTTLIKPLIVQQLDNITNLIKEYIEKEENKKVEKIWIEDGELKAL